MQLNMLAPAKGASQQKKRVGRGIGSGIGKTAGRGHKGQKSRAGGFHKTGFEGGQMPLQRRLPKRGFVTFKKKQPSKKIVSLRLSDLSKVSEENIDINVMRSAGVVSSKVKKVKLYLSGQLEKKINLKNIMATNGAKAAVKAAGGSID